MNVEDMTAEQLFEAAAAKAGVDTPATSTSTKTVEVDGHEIVVDIAAVQSWPAFKVMQKIYSGDSDMDRANGMLALIELVTDVDEARLLEMAGGQNAPFIAVLTMASKILAAIFPKN